MEENKSCIASAIIVFENIKRDFGYIGQHMLDHGIDYRYVRRLETIHIKLDELINLMKGEIE